MKLVAKIRVFLATMLVVSLAGTVLALSSVRQAHFEMERVNLAHGVFDGYLSLQSHTYQLFKQYGDTLLVGARDLDEEKSELIDLIRNDIANIRQLIGTEIDLVGEEEIEELALLATIERNLEELIAALERIAAEASIDTIAEHWWELSRILDNDIDRDFRALIEEALAEEVEEVHTTRAEAAERLVLYRRAAFGFAGLAILTVIASLLTIERNITRPAQSVLDGARRFSEGCLHHRIAYPSRNEFGEIAAALDMMAEGLEAKTRALTDQNTALDRAVTERTQQLEALLAEAKRADSNRRRTLADVSHELRTPVTIIKGEADVALRGSEKSSAIYREALMRTRDAAEHTARLIDDLLFVARSETGTARLSIEEVELVALLHDLLHTFDPDVTFTTGVEHATVRADRDRLRQAILVLLDNAHRHGGTAVSVRLDPMPDGFRVAVTDNGPGMSDADKTQAFERFFRGSNSAERYVGGVGLGLPIALAIAEAHGGTVMLDDGDHGGTIATIVLPARPRLRAVS